MSGTRPEPGYRLHLFGGPRVTGPRGSVKLSPYQALLLALVHGNEGRPLSRRQAIWLLWQEDDTPRTRQRIRQLLYALKKRLGFQAIATSGDGPMGPKPDALRSDLQQFRRLLSTDQVSAAGDLLRKGFLSNITNWPSDELEDWVEARRLRLKQDVRETAARLWDDASRANSWPRRRQAAEVLLSLDPHDESAVRKAVEARAMTGKPEEAEAAYRAYLESLEEGRTPSDALLGLMERVHGLGEGLGSRVDAPAKAAPEPAFCGREGPLKELLALLHAPSDEVTMALVRGEAGMGKTRLLKEFAHSSHLKGYTCLVSGCSEFEANVPLSPLIDALTHPGVASVVAGLSDPWKGVLCEVAPELDPHSITERPVALSGQRLTRRLLEAFLRFFQAATTEGPVILVVDDLQWADETTLAVLRYLVRRWEAGEMRLILASRPEEVTPTSATRKFLHEHAEQTWIIELAPLERQASQEVLASLSGEPPAEAQAQALADLAGGVPFYLVQLAYEFGKGSLTLPHRSSGPLPRSLPIRRIVERRLRGAPHAATDVMTALSVSRSALGFDELQHITRQSAEDVAASLESLVEQRLVACSMDGTSEVTHQLIANAVYVATTTPVRILTHRRVAHSLEARGELTAEVALHYQRGGARSKALDCATRTARAARSTGAVAEAVQSYQLALEASHTAASTAALHVELGDLLYEALDPAGAHAHYARAEELGERPGVPPLSLESRVRMVDAQSLLGHLDHADATRLLQQLKRRAERTGRWLVAARALDAELHLHDRAGDVVGIRRVLHQAEALIGCSDARAECAALGTVSLHFIYGRVPRGIASARKAVELALKPGLAAELPSALNRLLIVLLQQGRLDSPEGREVLDLAGETACRGGDPLSIFSFALNKGVWLLDTGDLTGAEQALVDARRLLGRSESGPEGVSLLFNEGELALARHDHDDAKNRFERARRLIGSGPSGWRKRLATAGLGIALLRSGDLAGARACAEALPEDPEEWYYDPSLLAMFRTALMEKRGQGAEAMEYLGWVLDGIRMRFVPSWTKLGALQLRVGLRIGRSRPVAAREYLETARELGFRHRIQELERLVARFG